MESGYLYFGARSYDPKTALWLSADPVKSTVVSQSARLNSHLFTLGNPISLFDPDGRQAAEVLQVSRPMLRLVPAAAEVAEGSAVLSGAAVAAGAAVVVGGLLIPRAMAPSELDMPPSREQAVVDEGLARQAIEHFDYDCSVIHDDVNAFLSSESFASLAHWADRNDGIRRKLVARSNGLFFGDDLNQGMTLLPLPDLDETLLDCIWEYRRAG